MSAIENLNNYISKVKPLDLSWQTKVEVYLDKLALPHGGLGDLMHVATQLVATSKNLAPHVSSKCVVIMAADHGVAEEGVSSLPRVTDTLVKTILNGGAAVNILANEAKCDLKVVDMGVVGSLKSCIQDDNFFSKYINKTGTANFTKGPAMSREDCLTSILTGVEVAEGLSHRYDVFGVGDVGIGNTTSAAAIASVLLDLEVEKVTIYGSGMTKDHWMHKCEVVKKAINFHGLSSKDSVLKILTAVGGYEIAAIIGMIIGAAVRQRLLILDSFTSGVAALCAIKICPEISDYLIASHQTSEPGHEIILHYLKKKPLLKLNIGMAQGAGVPLAFNLIDNTAALLRHLNTTEELMAKEEE